MYFPVKDSLSGVEVGTVVATINKKCFVFLFCFFPEVMEMHNVKIHNRAHH